MLAGIPQSPVLWDPVTNKDNTLRRQNDRAAADGEGGLHHAETKFRGAAARSRTRHLTRHPPNYYDRSRRTLCNLCSDN